MSSPLVLESNEARRTAEAASVERLVNTYLRESGIGAPVPLADPPPAGRGRAMGVPLPATGECLAVVPEYRSALGHHRYGPGWWRATGAGWEPAGAGGVAELVVGEVAAEEADAGRRERRQRALLAQVADSVARTTRYVSAAAQAPSAPTSPTGAFLAAEQGISTGHPFHPTPKSAEGFSEDDLARYAPELGAVFSLHWFAVAPAALVEERVGGAVLDPPVLDPPVTVTASARRRLRPDQVDWPLLPVHPWQAAHLARVPALEAAIDGGTVVPLGPLGRAVHPTSSVRTVWDPGAGIFRKLALDVRITNFVRVNPPDQLRRSVDVSRLLAGHRSRGARPGFTVLLERGYRALAPAGLDDDARRSVVASSAAVWRDAPDLAAGPAPLVLAALLEPAAGAGEPPVAGAVRRAAEDAGVPAGGSFVRHWLRRYLGVSLVPLVRLLAEDGVGLEAHAQNTLVTLDGGWPVHVHVRDLEGASIDRDHAARAGPHAAAPPADSPALYPTEEVWRRFAYYVLVNHVGHLAATLGWSLGFAEEQLWAEVRRALEGLGDRLPEPGAGRVRALLDAPALPAKANLRSRFRERGEDPLYVDVPNPLSR